MSLVIEFRQATLKRQLLKAVKRNDVQSVRELLENGADPNAKKMFGAPPLIVAAREGYEEIVQLLLDHGAQVDAKESTFGDTALLAAAAAGHTGVVTKLLDHDADINLPGTGGFTALMQAAIKGDIAMAQLLLHRDANANIRNDNDHTALEIARHHGHSQLAAIISKASFSQRLRKCWPTPKQMADCKSTS